jgi:hypothetical protein
MRGYIGLLVALTALGACAPSAERPNVGASNGPSAQNICAVAYADPALNPIRSHIPFDDSQAVKASINYFADPNRPNAAQFAALQQYDAANRRCWDAWEQVGTTPDIQQARVSVNSALADLMGGKITYGEFNGRRANAITKMQAALQADRDRDRYAPYGPYGFGSYGYGPYGGSGFSLGLGVFSH